MNLWLENRALALRCLALLSESLLATVVLFWKQGPDLQFPCPGWRVSVATVLPPFLLEFREY